MYKIKNFLFSNYRLLIIGLILLVTLVMIFDKCRHSLKNPVIEDNYTPVQRTEHEKFSDSLDFASQTVLLAQTQAHVALLESSLQKALIRKINIGKTTTSVEFKDSIVYVKVPGTRDTVFTGNTTQHLARFPMRFIHDNNYLKQSYTVYSEDSSSIDNLNIINRGHLVIGEKGKWFQKKTLLVGLMNENPYIKIDSIRSVVYSPKERLQISLGPVLLVNKTGASAGVGFTFKKGIFSGTIGYKLF